MTATNGKQQEARDARRYWRLRVLGAALCESRELREGNVLRFTNLDEAVDEDIRINPSRGEAELYFAARPANQSSEQPSEQKPDEQFETWYESVKLKRLQRWDEYTLARKAFQAGRTVEAGALAAHRPLQGSQQEKALLQLENWLLEEGSELALNIMHRIMAIRAAAPHSSGAPEQSSYEQKYNRVMSLLRNTKMAHGLCEPRERKACTHCNAVEELDKLIAEYKGARVISQ